MVWGALDNVVLRAEHGVAEAVGAERPDVDERRSLENQVAEDLSHGGTLKEAVAGEAGRIEEAADAPRLADDGVVVRSDLVQTRPAALDARLRDPRRPAGGDPQQV